jgi:hypothetical protein
MPRARDRERLVREGVEQVRQIEVDPYPLQIDDGGVRCETLAEVLALLAAEARAGGGDEGLLAEIMLRSSDHPDDRETLLDAKAIMTALGYREIAAVLKRLARTSPRRMTWRERMQAFRERYNCR